MTKASVETEGKMVCNAEITFRVMPFPDDSFRANMEQVAAKIGFPMEALAHG